MKRKGRTRWPGNWTKLVGQSSSQGIDCSLLSRREAQLRLDLSGLSFQSLQKKKRRADCNFFGAYTDRKPKKYSD